MPKSPVIYTLEIGGTHTRGGVYFDGVTTQTAAIPTPTLRTDPERNRRLVFEALCRIVAETAGMYPPMDAVAVSITGTLRVAAAPDARRHGPFDGRELYLWSPNVEGLRNVPVLSWLEAANWHVPVHVENDANAALLSEDRFDSVLGINMGSGIGAAVKRDGRIEHIGSSWSCYEIGHGSRWALPEELVAKCECGSVMGCLEAAIGSVGLRRRYGVRPEDAPPDIYNKMRNEVVRCLAPAIADTAREFDLHTVLLSGGAAWGFDRDFDFVGAIVDQISYCRPGARVPHIELMHFGDTAGLHGVALALLDSGVVAAR